MHEHDKRWLQRLAELRQHVRDARRFRVTSLDDMDPNFRYHFVARRLMQVDGELAALERQVARLTGTLPFIDNVGEHQP